MPSKYIPEVYHIDPHCMLGFYISVERLRSAHIELSVQNFDAICLGEIYIYIYIDIICMYMYAFCCPPPQELIVTNRIYYIFSMDTFIWHSYSEGGQPPIYDHMYLHIHVYT